MRYDWTSRPTPDGPAHLLGVTRLETGEPATNATAEEMAAEILVLAGRVKELQEEILRRAEENAAVQDQSRRVASAVIAAIRTLSTGKGEP